MVLLFTLCAASSAMAQAEIHLTVVDSLAAEGDNCRVTLEVTNDVSSEEDLVEFTAFTNSRYNGGKGIADLTSDPIGAGWTSSISDNDGWAAADWLAGTAVAPGSSITFTYLAEGECIPSDEAHWLGFGDLLDTDEGTYEDPFLLVELVSFTAEAEVASGQATLSWETAAEIDNAGFHIWRSETEYGQYARITKDLIPAEGDETTGAVYSYIDTSATPGKLYFYKLEDIDYSGNSAFHATTGSYALLEEGWNVLNGSALAGMPVAKALASIEGQYGSVWGLVAEGWKMYDPVREAFSNLETFEAPYDYWIHMVEAATLDLP